MTRPAQAEGDPVGRATDRLERLRRAHERIAELTGRATSDDGLITVTVAATPGITGLQLDPRAMRLPSVDLAAAVVSLSAAARDDLDARRAEVFAEAGVDRPAVDPAGSAELVAGLRQALDGSTGDVRGAVERFRTALGR